MDPDRFRNSTSGSAVKTVKGHWAFIPNPLPPGLEWSSGLVSALAGAERSLAALAEKGSDIASPETLVRPFVRREAVLSSRIEGTVTTFDQLARFEADPKAGGADTLEVANYVRALEYGIQRMADLPVSLRLIREMHAELFGGLGREHLTPGEFRRSQNWVGPPGSTVENAPYVPPPVEEMWKGLDQLENYIYSKSDLPPLIRIGLIHYQFEALHPFTDGNGRVGRLLISLLLKLWDLLPHPWLYLSGYFEANRDAYYDALLGVSESGDWETWLLLFSNAVERQSNEAAAGLDRLEALREHYMELLGGDRSETRLLRVVEFLMSHPIASIRQIEHGAAVSDYKAARRYVIKLVDYGILREVTGWKRNRVYRADDIFAAIEGTLDI